MKKVIALDLGEKRVGVAVSDALGITAQARPTIHFSDETALIAKVKEMVAEEGAGEVVLGFPLNMDGSQGPKARESAAMAEKLREAVNIEVKLWDERLTSVAAQRMMIGADTTRKKRKQKVDGLAAQMILQGYLDSLDSQNRQGS